MKLPYLIHKWPVTRSRFQNCPFGPTLTEFECRLLENLLVWQWFSLDVIKPSAIEEVREVKKPVVAKVQTGDLLSTRRILVLIKSGLPKFERRHI